VASNIGSTLARIATATLLGLAALLTVATVRLVLEGRQHLEEGERRSTAGDNLGAVVELEEAARAYVPGSPYPRRALDRLGMLAKASEMRGDTRRAATTWEAVRRAILATRHAAQPNRDILERAERELRRLREHSGTAAPGERHDPAARPKDPSPVASILLFAGLLGWIGGSLALLVLPRRERTKPASSIPRLLAWAACLGGLVLWVAMSWAAG
jgi:hypothetical protein